MYHQALRIDDLPDFAPPNAVAMDPSELRFGPFSARPAARELTCDGQPVVIGSRAFDLLVVLLRSQGEIVSKVDIVRHVWPSTTVDESNLRFQMSMLRKALGEEGSRIKTIPGRGYLFSVNHTHSRAAPSTEADWLADGPAIVIIDRDPISREAIHRLLQPIRARIRSFRSLQAFLESDTLHAEWAPAYPPANDCRSIDDSKLGFFSG